LSYAGLIGKGNGTFLRDPFTVDWR